MASETTADDVSAEDVSAESSVPAGAAGAGAPASETASSQVAAKSAEFAALKPTPPRAGAGPLDRFYDVHVPVWAELGRVEIPLGELVKLDEGSVLMLDRPVSDPVDLVSQGVKLARGEVIVVDDCFAIRIKEIVSNRP